jgi:MFS transporter, PAT family, beta-lactamase induction signal transducer AmpG
LIQQPYTRPLNILFLVLPAGINMGFATVTFPYLLTHSGFTVAQTAGIVAFGVSASLWRFAAGPITDLTLSLRKWFSIAVIVSVVSILLLCITPITTKGALLLTIIYFVSQIAANLVLLPVGGFMANRIEPGRKGRAAGWYQAGNLGGVGLGGGAGLWLATHYSIATAGIVLCVLSLASGFIVLFIKDVEHEKDKQLTLELINMGKGIISMIRIPVVLFVMIMLCMPIGTGAAANLWSAIAADWKTDADTVSLVTGILSGLVSALGCVAGGFIADRKGNWIAYLGAGAFCAVVTVIMAISPMLPYVYIGGVLAYAFGLGLINAAFSSVILYAIGKKNASTKYALLSSLGNLPVVYMTTFDGWAHDKFTSKYMLIAETAVGLGFILISMVVLQQMKARKLLLQTID